METIEYDEKKDVLLIFDLDNAAEKVIDILDLILVGDEVGVFDEWEGDTALEFSIKSHFYGFTKKG